MIESEIKRENAGILVRGFTDFRNCPFDQYSSGADEAGDICHVPDRCDLVDLWNGIFSAGSRNCHDADRRRYRSTDIKDAVAASYTVDRICYGCDHHCVGAGFAGAAEQVPSVPNLTLIITVAVGVGLFLALAIFRILFQVNLSVMLSILYILLIGASFLVPKDFLAVAFDSGGVTTGPMTVPFIMAMGVGLASVRGDKNAADDSFGLVALSSVGPVLAVLILGCFYKPTEAAYTLTDVASVETTRDVVHEFLKGMPVYAREVFVSLLPIVAVFLIFQMISRRYKERQMKRIFVGFVYTYIGLVLFLCGVNVGFAPVGSFLGKSLGVLSYKWVLVPIGAVIGYYIVKAEPAIQVLNHQVEGVTNGAISVKTMNRCLSVGVSVSVGLAMIKVLAGIPIQWIVIPGYILALVLSRFVPKIFVGIAFDSGGVASGPMTTTFLLPLSMGACEAVGGNLMTDAFGVVALVALTPLIAVQVMGLLYRYKLSRAERASVPETVAITQSNVDEIFEFEEEYDDDAQ